MINGNGPSYAAFLLGWWLLICPVSFGYESWAIATSTMISGLLILTLACLTRTQKRAWPHYVGGLVGVWLGFAPLIFHAPFAVCSVNGTLTCILSITLFLLLPKIPGQLPDEGPSVPPGWSYNPSAWSQRLPIILLATIGWFISQYLGSYQLGYTNYVWDPFFGNGTLNVITSKISRSLPFSDAGLGALAYCLEVLLACKGGERRWRTMPWLVLLFGLLVVPLSLVSIILIVLQPIVVDAWCTLCLFNAFAMLWLVALGIDEVVAALQYLGRCREKPFWPLFFKGGDCPGATEDDRSPPLTAPWRTLLSAGFWGISFPWNLIGSALVGLELMLLPWFDTLSGPLATADWILGPFAIVASVVALAEVARPVRYLNCLFGLCILIFSFWHDGTASHITTSLMLIALSIRRGPTREQSGKLKG